MQDTIQDAGRFDTDRGPSDASGRSDTSHGPSRPYGTVVDNGSARRYMLQTSAARILAAWRSANLDRAMAGRPLLARTAQAFEAIACGDR